MNIRRFAFFLTHPIYSIRMLLVETHYKLHPDEPWISPAAVRFCDQHLDRQGSGLEWGSGRSTLWFANRLARLQSIEYDRGWYEAIRDKLRSTGVSNVELQFIPLNHPISEGTRPVYEPTPLYVQAASAASDGSLALVIVDGHYRQACVLAALLKIKPGGYLLVDNSDRIPLHEWGVPDSWPIVHQSATPRGETTLWQKPAAIHI